MVNRRETPKIATCVTVLMEQSISLFEIISRIASENQG